MKIVLSLFLCVVGCATAQTRMITHVTNPEGSFATQILMVNSGAAPADYTLTAYAEDGSRSGTVQGTLAAGATISREATALFNGLPTAWFQIESDDGLQVFAQYNSSAGGSPAQVAATTVQTQRRQFFPGNWDVVFDGFAVVNTGVEAMDLMLRHHGGDGAVKAQQTVISALGVHAKGLALIDSGAFELSEGDYFQLEGAQPFAFMGLRFNRPDSTFLFETPAAAMGPTPEPVTGKREFTLLFTNDEHGWMEPTDSHGGAAGLMGQWREQEGFTNDGNFIVLSGGDMWTGPAVSSWTRGESMAAVMNALQYDAAAIGNHEFDFGIDTLNSRQSESSFPFLAANIKNPDGSRPGFAKPFTIVEVNGVNVGIIGLTTVNTPRITFPTITGAYDFIGYETALREVEPLVRAHGADVVVVTAHTCTLNLLPLASTFAELNLSLVAGGHCNHRRVEVAEGVPVIEAGSFLRYYGRVGFEVDLEAGTVTSEAVLVENVGGTPDAEVQGVVDFWLSETDAELNEVIGYTESGVGRRSTAMSNLIVNAWLESFPGVDAAFNHGGGIRQDIPAGEITRATIVGVLPFENVLYEMELTGQHIEANLNCCNPLLGGIRRGDVPVFDDGSPIVSNEVYRVLTSDFNYAGGGGFLFSLQDPDPFDTGLNWREPVIDWIIGLETSVDNPLDQYLDFTVRKSVAND